MSFVSLFHETRIIESVRDLASPRESTPKSKIFSMFFDEALSPINFSFICSCPFASSRPALYSVYAYTPPLLIEVREK